MSFLVPFIAGMIGMGGAVTGGVATAGTAAAIGAGATTAGVLTAGATLYAGSKVLSTPKLPALQPTPAGPSYAAIQADESAKLLRAAQAQTKTILTSPLGVTSPQDTKRKMLLGQ